MHTHLVDPYAVQSTIAPSVLQLLLFRVKVHAEIWREQLDELLGESIMREKCIFTVLLIAILIQSALLTSCSFGQTVGGATQPVAFYGEGYVLLQHGSVLHGFVKPQADRLTVVLDKGNEVTLPNRQVLSVGKTIESLYNYQVKAIRAWGTGEHWHLAQWCLQNGLLDQAIEHYLALENVAADNPKFKQLDHQIKQALLADTDLRQAMLERGIAIPENPDDSATQRISSGSLGSESNASNPKRPEPMNSRFAAAIAGGSVPTASDVQTASAFQSDHAGQAGGMVGGIVKAGANIATHDGKVIPAPPRLIPGYLRRSFQIEVTPIVVSRCGQSGCHGMLAKNDFQIFQPVGEQAAAITETNLESLLRYIDTDAPRQSVFLSYATRPHGMQRNASLNPSRDEDRVLLEKIQRWLQSLSEVSKDGADGSSVVTAASIAHGQDVSSPQVAPAIALVPKNTMQKSNQRRRMMGETVAGDRNAKLSKPAKSAPPPAILNAVEIQELEDAITKLERIEAGSKPTRDPLDPSVFNSKYSNGSAKPN